MGSGSRLFGTLGTYLIPIRGKIKREKEEVIKNRRRCKKAGSHRVPGPQTIYPVSGGGNGLRIIAAQVWA